MRASADAPSATGPSACFAWLRTQVASRLCPTRRRSRVSSRVTALRRSFEILAASVKFVSWITRVANVFDPNNLFRTSQFCGERLAKSAQPASTIPVHGDPQYAGCGGAQRDTVPWPVSSPASTRPRIHRPPTKRPSSTVASPTMGGPGVSAEKVIANPLPAM
jgi:hypothetical protein